MASLVSLASHKFPEFLRIAANHLIGGAEPWPKSVEIDLVGSVPHRVAVGQHLDIRMRLKKGNAGKAVVKYRFDNGPWQNQVIQRGRGRHLHRRPRRHHRRGQGPEQAADPPGGRRRPARPERGRRARAWTSRASTAFVTAAAPTPTSRRPGEHRRAPGVTVIGSDVDLKVSSTSRWTPPRACAWMPSTTAAPRRP